MPASVSQAETTLSQVLAGAWDHLSTDGPSQNARIAAVSYNGDDRAFQGRLSSIRQANVSLFNSWRPQAESALIEWATAAGPNFNGRQISQDMIRQLRRYLADEGEFSGGSIDKYVTPRGWTRGSFPSITGLKGYRLAVDEWGHVIDSGDPQNLYFQMANGISPSQFSVLMTSDNQGLDVFARVGSSVNAEVEAISDRSQGGNLTVNPFIADGVTDGVLASTSVNGWTVGTAAHWTIDSTATQVYRARSKTIKTATNNATIFQQISREIPRGVPHMPVVICYPTGMASGDGITINWGGKSQAFVSLTQNAINILVPDRDLDLYPEQFDDATNGKRIMATVGRSSGTMHICGILWVPMVRVPNDPTWWAFLIDQTTPLVTADGTLQDTVNNAGRINWLLWELFRDSLGAEAYLPNVGTNLITNLS
jgi:hypothetical protein